MYFMTYISNNFAGKENERVVIMSAESLLDILQKQNNPIEIFEIEKM